MLRFLGVVVMLAVGLPMAVTAQQNSALPSSGSFKISQCVEGSGRNNKGW